MEEENPKRKPKLEKKVLPFYCRRPKILQSRFLPSQTSPKLNPLYGDACYLHVLQHSVASFTLVVPFFPSGTSEEKDEEAYVPTADALGFCHAFPSQGVSVAFLDDGAQEALHELFLEFPLKVLNAIGAKEVSAYVTHAVFPNRSWERFIHRNDGSENPFSHFWFTDSCPVTVKAIENIALFKVLSLVRSIADMLIDEDDA
ncbi:Ribose-phosphate pyrophosphokinase 4-like protein [Drosera capensis]